MNKIHVIGDEEELAEDLQKELFELKHNPNIIEIPDNATNGDVIKAVFPETKIYDDIYVMHIGIGRTDMNFRKDWWNAPYKKGE